MRPVHIHLARPQRWPWFNLDWEEGKHKRRTKGKGGGQFTKTEGGGGSEQPAPKAAAAEKKPAAKAEGGAQEAPKRAGKAAGGAGPASGGTMGVVPPLPTNAAAKAAADLPPQQQVSNLVAQHFSAAEHAAAHNDLSVTTADVLKEFPPDTAAKIQAVNERLAVTPETISIHKHGGVYTPERQLEHQRIIDKFMSDAQIAAATPAAGDKPTFTLLGGRGGSGKSGLKHTAYNPDTAIVLNSDDIKEELPEYEGWNAAQVHEESTDLFNRMTDLAKQLGLNIVHDATMKSPDKAVALATEMKSAGYRLEAHYMFLPVQHAANRAVKRFLGDTGRFVPPSIVLSNTRNEHAFDQVKGMCDAWSFRDNNVPKGTKAKLLAEYRGTGTKGDQ